MIISKPVNYSNTIFKRYMQKNAGGDTQLQLKANYQGGEQNGLSRILLSQPQQVNFQYETRSLRIYPSHANIFEGNYTLQAVPITNTWEAGFSLFSMRSFNIRNGSSWKFRNKTQQWETYGGQYNASQSLSKTISYRNIYQVVDFVIPQQWNIQNGILLKFLQQEKSIGSIFYYSSNTRKNLYPRYVYYIDDYQYVTSSSNILVSNTKDYIVSIDNLKNKYDKRQTVKFELRFTPRKYKKTWSSSTASYQDTSYILDPQIDATYSVYDVSQMVHLELIQHSPYTRINSNAKSNYFNLDMSQFLQNRSYRIELKIDGNIIPLKENFKIV